MGPTGPMGIPNIISSLLGIRMLVVRTNWKHILASYFDSLSNANILDVDIEIQLSRIT